MCDEADGENAISGGSGYGDIGCHGGESNGCADLDGAAHWQQKP